MTDAFASLFDRSPAALAALAHLDAPSRGALSGFELALALVASGGSHPDFEHVAAELDDDALVAALDPTSWLVLHDDSSETDLDSHDLGAPP